MVELVAGRTFRVDLRRERNLVVPRPAATWRTVFTNASGWPSFREGRLAIARRAQSHRAHRSGAVSGRVRLLSDDDTAESVQDPDSMSVTRRRACGAWVGLLITSAA